MRTNNNEFTDDNLVKFTMERKRVAISVYAIVVKGQISSKGMELVEKHVTSWDNQLPEFVLKANNPEDDPAIVDAMWKKIGTTFENIKTSFGDESLVCLKFAGFTQGRKSVEDFLKCVMMLPAKDSKSIIKKMQDVGRALKTDAWCKLIFTERAFLKRVNGFKAQGTVSL